MVYELCLARARMGCSLGVYSMSWKGKTGEKHPPKPTHSREGKPRNANERWWSKKTCHEWNSLPSQICTCLVRIRHMLHPGTHICGGMLPLTDDVKTPTEAKRGSSSCWEQRPPAQTAQEFKPKQKVCLPWWLAPQVKRAEDNLLAGLPCSSVTFCHIHQTSYGAWHETAAQSVITGDVQGMNRSHGGGKISKEPQGLLSTHSLRPMGTGIYPRTAQAFPIVSAMQVWELPRRL